MARGIPLTELIFPTGKAVYECDREKRGLRNRRSAHALADRVVEPSRCRLSAELAVVQVPDAIDYSAGARRPIHRDIVDTEVMIWQSGIFAPGDVDLVSLVLLPVQHTIVI